MGDNVLNVAYAKGANKEGKCYKWHICHRKMKEGKLREERK
jgi:hypothetical protein